MAQAPNGPPLSSRRPHACFALLASLAATVLIIGALVVACAPFSSKLDGGNTSQAKTAPGNVTLSGCASQPMPVLVNLCTHHQLTDLAQSQKVGAYTLMFERAYLDMNQLLITYRIFSQSTGHQTMAELIEGTTDTIVTTSQGQSFKPTADASGPTGPQVVQFSTPPLTPKTRVLQLQVLINTMRIESLPSVQPTAVTSPPTVVPGPAAFDFTLAYHSGLVVTPHQTVTINGNSMILEKVLISPSETIVEGKTKGNVPDSADTTFSLNAAGRNSDPAFSGFGGNGNPFQIGFYDELLGQHGIWTFGISLTASAPPTWEFHFRVP